MSPDFALKILSDSGSSVRVGGYGVVFGGQDVTADRFTKATDFWFDRITQNPPVLYQHGADSTIKRSVVGRVTSTTVDDVGLWVEAQLTAASKYMDAIRQLVAKGILGWSSGSVPHLVQRVKAADSPGVSEITSWPIVEFSLTPTPAEPRTVGVKELKSLAALDPLLTEIADQAETAARKTLARTRAAGITPDSSVANAAKDGGNALTDLPDGAFAYVEAGTLDDEKKTFPRSNRHYPHHDESGAVDSDELKAALEDAAKATDSAGLAHLLRHAHALESGTRDDAHASQWAEGAAPALLVVAAKMVRLSEIIAEDRLAMERLGLDTKSGARLNVSMRTAIKDLHSGVGQLLEWAENIERGEDGKNRVDMFRHRLAMLELEEVS